jgi:hypothetical protein
MKLPAFDPPGFLPDYKGIPGQLEQWSKAISGWMDEAIQTELQRFAEQSNPKAKDNKCQFFNASETDPGGSPVEQAIVWNAFPRTLELGYGYPTAFQVADSLVSLAGLRPGIPTAPVFFVGPIWDTLVYRPQDEYCEWRVERDPESNKIIRITFTSEPPEYWQALNGDTLQSVSSGAWTFTFPGSPKTLLALYREYVNPKIDYDDLICHEDFVDYTNPSAPAVIYQKGAYNPYNRWNTTHGLMHLCQPNNTISAEIQLAADATVLYQKDRRPVVIPDELVCCAQYGGSARSSDPTIGGTVNSLARLGFWITLANPVGLYMNDLNAEGWTKPNGESIAPDEYFRVLRGDKSKGLIERAVLEVPAKEGFTVSDLRIAGVPIRYGGQVAQKINIKLVGQAQAPGSFSNATIACTGRCGLNQALPRALTRPSALGDPLPEGYIPAFEHKQGTYSCTEEPPTHLAAAAEALPAPVRRRPPHKHR